jgi:FMN phosphatase YigB (HAD superfamily)
MVGDDLQRDIAGAQKLGIYSIWCDYGRNGLPEGSRVKPDKIINNIAELLSL